MTNVLATRMINITLPNHVRTLLKLPAQIPELEFVRLMWESMYVMLDTLMSEPALPHECLRDSALEGSPQPEDYRCCYSDLQKEAYKFHAERFYQLFKLRFTHERLILHKMKLVDYGLYFMESLPVPLCRFQAEGSEHFNYEHNRFYYGHTTRHGGNTRCEPLKALFLHMWRRICYDVRFNTRTAATKKGHQPLINLFPIIVLQPPFKNMLVAGWWERSFQNKASFRNHRLPRTGSQITRLLLACCRILSFLRASHPWAINLWVDAYLCLLVQYQNFKTVKLLKGSGMILCTSLAAAPKRTCLVMWKVILAKNT